MAGLDELVARIDELTTTVDDEPLRGHVLEFLDDTHGVYWISSARLAESLGAEAVEHLVAEDPAVAWPLEGSDDGRGRLPEFLTLDVEEDDAAPHPPPGPTLLQIEGVDQ